MNQLDGLDESQIPPELLEQTRAWWVRRMQEAERSHGEAWPKHRDWLADYMNAEIREQVAKRGLR